MSAYQSPADPGPGYPATARITRPKFPVGQGALSAGGWAAVRAYRPERRHRPSHRDPLLSHTLRRLPPASCPPFPPPPTVGGRRAATTTAAARLGSGRGRLAGTVRCGSRQVAAVGAARSAACPATRPPPSTGTPTDGDRGRAAVAWLVTSRRRQWQHRVWGAYHPPPPYVPTDPRKACQLGVAWLRGCSPRRNPPPRPQRQPT